MFVLEIGMILSYRDSMTEVIASGKAPRGFPSDILKRALNKLTVLDYAKELDDLRWPPGNRLELLSGDRQGQHSIRVNDQWRICFVWTGAGPESVEIVDYH
jgi:toxin HigB-1